jgi:uncharacterized membrane protein YgcG
MYRSWVAWLCMLAACALSSSAGAQEVIRSFDSVVQVAKDGTLTVTETIAVTAEDRAIRRGIYRDFPLTFRDAAGRTHEVTFSLKSVTRDGRPEPHFTERQHNAIRIYAGEKSVILRPGNYTYVITYETGRQIRWFDGKPELNWNVTGNFWNFPIFTATYELQLPDGVKPVRWIAFTGRLGARGTSWHGDVQRNGALHVETTRRLAPREGLTVVAEIPQGAVAPPDAATELWYTLLDYRRWIIGTLGFGLVLIYYGAAWRAAGRDPKRGVIIPLFHPPQGISPALANYIHNWGFSREKWRAFTAAALSLAVRGVLQFDDRADSLTLKVTGKRPEGGFSSLPPGERAILTWVDSRGGSAAINRQNGTKVAEVGTKFTKSIESENKNKFFRRNLGYLLAGVALTAGVVAAIAIFGGLQDKDLSILFVTAFGGVWLGLFLLPILTSLFGAVSSHSLIRITMTVIVLGIFASIAGNFVRTLFHGEFSRVWPTMMSVVMDNPFPFALVASFAALNGLFLYLMRAPTALGRPVMDQLDGFKLYLETAEADRLNLQAPEITAERFEALLPYAVALDVEKPWSNAFAKALARAHPGESDPMSYYTPGWRTGGGWSSSDFSSSVASTVSSASSAFASAVPASSSSSGFSGGGGSGGGGGGGGGGGW